MPSRARAASCRSARCARGRWPGAWGSGSTRSSGAGWSERAIGDPSGPAEEIPGLLDAFQAYCREHDWQFAFFQARPEQLPLYRARNWRALHIGEDPVLWLDRFGLEGSAIGEVRRAVHKL